MRLRTLLFTLVVAFAPAALADDHDHDHGHGWRHSHGHRGCWERPPHAAWSRWEAREAWRRCEPRTWRYRHCPPWEREAWMPVPAPSFHVRIVLP